MSTRRNPRWSTELVSAVALEQVAQRRVNRAILRAFTQLGMSQSAIGAILGISQAQVNRRLRQLRRTPELLDQTPADVLNERAVDLITTDEMMQQLRTWPFTFGSVPAVHGDATDTYVRGPWDDVEAAYHQKLLSDNEMQELLAVHRLKIGVPAVGR